MKLPKNPFNKSETSLNHAKLDAKDLHELQIYVGLDNNKKAELERMQMESAIITHALDMHKRELLDKYKLRKGKKYGFNLQTGDIHKANKPPKPVVVNQANNISEEDMKAAAIDAARRIKAEEAMAADIARGKAGEVDAPIPDEEIPDIEMVKEGYDPKSKVEKVA